MQGFHPPAPPDLPEDSTTVLVVGAGPTGLMLAAELVRRDVDCLLIDAHDAPLGWDRATVVHARTIEVFEALGLADLLLKNAVKVRRSRLHSDAHTLGELDLGSTGSRYGFDLGLSEDVTESVLTKYIEDRGGAVARSTRLLGIEAFPNRVVATVERNGERQTVAASWMVGCDGVHSVIRRMAGVEFLGRDLEIPWAVFDASIKGWAEDFDVNFAYFDMPPVILCPLPARRWRVYVRPISDTSDLVADAAATIRRYAPSAKFAAVENANRFQCHSRVARTFRSGRIFLAGDAAHSCSPSEGHGMNTGIQDAFNLGWKLALACQGVREPALLDSYETERRPVALRVVASGDAFETNQAMTTQHERAQRDVVLRRTLADAGSAHHEAAAAAEIDRSYADSGLARGDADDHLSPGDLLPNTIEVKDGSGEVHALHEMTHRLGHTVLIVGGRAASCEDVLHVTVRLESTVAASPVVDAVIGLCTKPEDERIGCIDESAADQLGIDGVTILAVRPDRYVGFRLNGGDVGPLESYLQAFTN